MNTVLLILFIVVILLLIGFPVFVFYAVAHGIDNKYSDYDKQMFLEGSKLPPIPSEEDQSDIQ